MNLLSSISQREKKVLLIGGIIVVLIFIYHLSVWYGSITATYKEYIETKQITLEKQLNKIDEKEDIQKEFNILSDELKKLEREFISADKPPVAAARIQRLLKQIASSNNIDIILEKALNPEDTGLYLEIPVEIGFRASAEKLKKMLYEIKTSRLLLTISEIKVKVTNIKNPLDTNTTLIVKGFIKKSQEAKDKEEKEGSNAS